MRPRTSLTVIALAASCIAQVAHAGVIRHDVADSDYLSLAAQSEYSGVGEVLYSTSGGSYRCSGTLIDASWVLTAAHCLDDPTTTSVTYSAGGVTYSAARWVYHNTFDENQLFDANDIALIELSSAATGIAVAELYTGGDEFGRVGTTVGFGNTGTGLTGELSGTSGTKRAGNNIIESYVNSSLLWADFDSGSESDNALGIATQLGLEYLFAPGDSGGGLFVNIDGIDYLAGVHSFFANGNDGLHGNYGDLQASTRVSEYIDWIETNSGLHFGTVPNVGSVYLLLVGLMGLRRLRSH